MAVTLSMIVTYHNKYSISLWQRGFYILCEFMDQEDRIYTLKLINVQHYRGNIIHSNHGNGTQPNKDVKVFKKAPTD